MLLLTLDEVRLPLFSLLTTSINPNIMINLKITLHSIGPKMQMLTTIDSDEH